MRILSGRYKGRKLLPPVGRDVTRPMTALIKKSLFDSLAAWLPEAVVADLYCGTGNVGLEALSRGARRCCFADRDRLALNRLKRNIETVGAAQAATVWAGVIETHLPGWLAELGEELDLAFVDPPFPAVREWDWPRMERAMFAPLAAATAADGLVVLRTPDRAEPPERLAELAAVRVRRYGGMSVTMYGRPDVVGREGS